VYYVSLVVLIASDFWSELGRNLEIMEAMTPAASSAAAALTAATTTAVADAATNRLWWRG
jgi:hypothetical protein